MGTFVRDGANLVLVAPYNNVTFSFNSTSLKVTALPAMTVQGVMPGCTYSAVGIGNAQLNGCT
jgi:hypothetical protein